jgi:hypothetical protein
MYLFHFTTVKSSYGGFAMKNRKKTYSVAAVLLSLFLVSCEKEKISDINADPGRFHGKEVQIAGKVTQSIGALGKGVYQLNDGSGSLWVYSDQLGVPSKGVTVGVKGTVVPTFTFLGVNYATVLRETDRRSAKGN